MRIAMLSALLVISCGTDGGSPPTEPQRFSFGPFELEPGQELTSQCVSATLGNEQPIYVRAVELETAAGVHHSNWFWVADHAFDGPDGVWRCADRGFNEATAGGLYGGVLFAQSTQATHEIQELAQGAVIKIPARARIVSGLHLLNPTDFVTSVPLSITIRPLPESEVTTIVAGLAFENHSIEIPAHATSRFTVECDVGAHHQAVFGRPIDFKVFHVLPHYHELGAGMTVEAIRDSDGSADLIWTTDARAGDRLGGKLDPPFDMTGHAKLRFSCTFENPRDAAVGWGVGDQEMCIVFAFTDSEYTWAGGVLTKQDPGPGTVNGDVIDYTAPGCQLLTADASH